MSSSPDFDSEIFAFDSSEIDSAVFGMSGLDSPANERAGSNEKWATDQSVDEQSLDKKIDSAFDNKKAESASLSEETVSKPIQPAQPDDLEMFELLEDSKRNDIWVHCFHCNRKESFFGAYQRFWFYSYIIGFTFGIAKLIGPYKCRCCGHRRWMRWDLLHPRRWV